jgi:hypothetical protein
MAFKKIPAIDVYTCDRCPAEHRVEEEKLMYDGYERKTPPGWLCVSLFHPHPDPASPLRNVVAAIICDTCARHYEDVVLDMFGKAASYLFPDETARNEQEAAAAAERGAPS